MNQQATFFSRPGLPSSFESCLSNLTGLCLCRKLACPMSGRGIPLTLHREVWVDKGLALRVTWIVSKCAKNMKCLPKMGSLDDTRIRVCRNLASEKASGFEVWRPPTRFILLGELVAMHSLRYGSHDLFELAPEVEELVKAYVIDLKVPWQAEFGFPKRKNVHWAWFFTEDCGVASKFCCRVRIFFGGNLSKCPHFFVYDWGGERSLAGSDQHAILCKWRGMSLATSQHKFLGEVAAWFNTVLSAVWTLQPEEPPVCGKSHAGCGRLNMHGMYVWLLFCSIAGSRRPDIYLPALSSRFCSALWSFVPVRAMWFWRISRCCGWQLLQALWEGWVSRWKRTK